MRRQDHALEAAWNGLTMTCSAPRRPGLRIEVAAGWRMVLRQADQHALLASVDGDHGGVSFYRTGRYRSPIPPLRAAHAQAVANTDAASRDARWAYYFADRLTNAPSGPLHDGTWMLTPHVEALKTTSSPRSPSEQWQQLIAAGDPKGYIDWFTGKACGALIPLNRLPEPGDGRVKFYRKQLREGILPPVLVWWISGLDAYVLLDGHHRLTAALADDQEPPLLALHRLADPAIDIDHQARRYNGTMQHLEPLTRIGVPGTGEAVARAGAVLADGLLRIYRTPGRTRAWPLPGAEPAWRATAQADAPDWLAETDRLS